MSTGPSAKTVRVVRERDDHRCARCGGAERCGPLSTQHRVARGMGGTSWPGINLPSNLLTLGGSGTTGCHGWVEHHPTYARNHGYAVASHARELVVLVPIWTWRGWVELREDGDLTHLPDHPGVPGCDCGCRLPVPATPSHHLEEYP